MITKKLPSPAAEPKVHEAFGYIARCASALERKKLFRPFEVEIVWAPAWTIRLREREGHRGARRCATLCRKADVHTAMNTLLGAVAMLALLPADEELL